MKGVRFDNSKIVLLKGTKPVRKLVFSFHLIISFEFFTIRKFYRSAKIYRPQKFVPPIIPIPKTGSILDHFVINILQNEKQYL